MRAFAHHDDADAEALGVLDHRREVAVVRDEDQGRGRVGAGHQLHRVDRQAHVRGVLAGRVAALVDEFQLDPFLGGGAPAAEAAVEVTVGFGRRDGRLADEAAQGGEVLVGHVVRVDQHADALVGLGLGGFGRGSGGGVGLALGRFGGSTPGGLRSAAGGSGLLGFGSGHGRESFLSLRTKPWLYNANPPVARVAGRYII